VRVLIHVRHMTDPLPRNSKQPDSRRGAVLGLVVTAALIVIGLVLVKVLGDAGRLQDCVMSGRSNCAPVDSGAARNP
jgi:hypothetical protein